MSDGGDDNVWDHGDWAMARLTMQPTVAAASFAFESAPHALSFTFRGNVSQSLSESSFTIQNLTTDTPVPTESMQLDYDLPTDTATLTFPGFSGGILPDGKYRATLHADGVTDANGNPMPADFEYYFFFLRGDANHDASVNLLDFNIVSANFNQSMQTFSGGDFNYDGVVNLLDFNILAARFNTELTVSKSSLPALRRLEIWKPPAATGVTGVA